MKNTINIDKNINFIPTVNSEDAKTNEIWLNFLNVPTGGVVDIFYGCDYRKQFQISPGVPWQLPDIYCSDGEMVKFRWYLDEEEHSGFISLIGDESLYKDLVISKKSNTLLVCDGSLKPIKTDYMIELARLISDTTGATPKDCYEDLLEIRNKLVDESREKGVDIDSNATLEVVTRGVEQITSVQSYIPLLGSRFMNGKNMYSALLKS
ncbi:unknown [Roseburia sp. CAG:309]|nr:unknown [Roseburia sp. CAG:309]